jgi:hypothetical protein
LFPEAFLETARKARCWRAWAGKGEPQSRFSSPEFGLFWPDVSVPVSRGQAFELRINEKTRRSGFLLEFCRLSKIQ